MAQNKKTLVIVPAYNEEASLAFVVKDLSKLKDIDVLIVNDGSTDTTLDLLKKYHWPHLDLVNNLGIGGAVQAGYQYALRHNYDIAIQFDGDGQHCAKEIPRLVKALNKCDMVIGSRFVSQSDNFQSSLMRRVGISFLSWLIKAIGGAEVKDVTSGFRGVNRPLIKQFASAYPVDYPEPDTLARVSFGGFRVKEIAAQMRERKAGESSITPLRGGYYILKVSASILLTKLTSRKKRIYVD